MSHPTCRHPACGKPQPGEVPSAYGQYLAELGDGDLRRILEEQRLLVLEELGHLDEEAGAHRYAPGKWSVAQVAGHLADTEQIFLERALRAARGDDGPQPAFDEDRYASAWVPGLEAERTRWLEQRRAAASFFSGLPEDAWLRRGRVEDRSYTVRALGWILAAHVSHHLRVLAERYRPGLPPRRGALEAEPRPGLRLRQVGPGDLDELYALSSAEWPRLREWLDWAVGEPAPEATWRFLTDAREDWLRRGTPNLAIRTAEGLAGMIGLNPLGGRAAHIGYWLTAAAEGRGLVRESARWLTAHSFDELGLDRVEIRCATGNHRSRAVPEALGFPLEGVLRGAQHLPRGRLDLALYAVTAADWPVLRDAWGAAGGGVAATPRCRVLRAADAELVLEQAGVRGWRLGEADGRRLVRVLLEAGAMLAPHAVPDRALFWVAAGRGRLVVGGQAWDLASGDAAVVSGGAERGWEALDGPLDLRVLRGW